MVATLELERPRSKGLEAAGSAGGAVRGVGLRTYFARTYAVLLVVDLPFLRSAASDGLVAKLYALVVWATQGWVYLLPAALLTTLAHALLARGPRARASSWRRRMVRGVAVLGTALTVVTLFLDQRIHALYGFHVNGFVLNLVTTPGGLESMGASASTWWIGGLLLAGLFALQVLLLRELPGRLRCPGWLRALGRPRVWVPALLVSACADGITYGAAHAGAFPPVLAVAEAFPFHPTLTFDGLVARLGFELPRRPTVAVPEDGGRLAYPLAPLDLEPPARPLNVLWLVGESLRADALNDEVMPATMRFAERSVRFLDHHSGGNGTRMGVFSMFYGLYGTYWFPVLDDRRGPVLVEAMLRQGYRCTAHTSARFTYPEFDSTVFVDLDQADLTEFDQGQGWERDRASVAAVLENLRTRDRSRPFFQFAFLESPHARYGFPEESVIRRPYLPDLNYATMSLERDIEPIRARYLNACHHLDQQLARVFEALEAEGLLEDTIVVVTGDHGEEFLEHGRWGHGSSFVDEQVHVPLVLHVPGEAPRVVERTTSHVDLPATLLPRLGVRNPPGELSLGHDLLAESEVGVCDFAVVADWTRACVVTPRAKASFPFRITGAFRDESDPSSGGTALDAPSHFDHLPEVLEGMGRFLRR